MTLDQLVVTAVGAALIVFIYWFFFGKSEVVQHASGSLDVLVDGGYSPHAIRTPVGTPLTLTFKRKDPSPCLEEIVFPDFGLRRYLPLHEAVPITIKPTARGEYSFSCGMNMYHGKIIAE